LKKFQENKEAIVESTENFLNSLEPSTLETEVFTSRKLRGPPVYKDSTPFTRFRDVAREICAAYRDLEAVKKKNTAKWSEENIPAWFEEENSVSFNVNAFRAGPSGTAASLAKKVRTLFSKSYLDRTDKDIDMLYPVVEQLNYFSCYSVSARREIARVLGYESYEDGRVIMREGDKGTSMYFIITGAVSVLITYVDKTTGEKQTMVVAKLTAGTSFGELALIQDCTRSATIKCIGNSTFLRINKDELEVAQIRSQEKETEERRKIVESMHHFKKWDQKSKNLVLLNCKILSYDPEKVVLGNLAWDPPEFIYFLISGQCKIVKKIFVIETKSPLNPQQKQIKFVTSGTKPENTRGVLRSRLLQIGSLHEGDAFNVGEDLKSTYIIAVGKIKCLVVSGYLLDTFDRIAKNTNEVDKRLVKTMKNLKDEAKNRIMSQEEAFRYWLINLKWISYKKKLVRDVLKDKSEKKIKNWKKTDKMVKCMIQNPTFGESPISQTNFRSMAELKRKYSEKKYSRLLNRLDNEPANLVESNDEERYISHLGDVPNKHERKMIKSSFSVKKNI